MNFHTMNNIAQACHQAAMQQRQEMELGDGWKTLIDGLYRASCRASGAPFPRNVSVREKLNTIYDNIDAILHQLEKESNHHA